MRDGIKECLCLAATGTRGGQEAFLVANGMTKRLLLMKVQRSIRGRQQAQPVVQEAASLLEQLGEDLALLEVGKRLNVGPLNQLLLLQQ